MGKDILEMTDQKVIELLNEDDLDNEGKNYYGIGAKSGRLVVYKKDKGKIEKMNYICGNIILTGIERKINDNKIFLEIAFMYETSDNKRLVKTVIERKSFNNPDIYELASLGYGITSKNIAAIRMHIMNQEKLCSESIVHKFIGWNKYKKDNKECETFFHNTALGIESSYIGDLAIEPKGKFSTWQQMINDEVIGQIPLEISLAFGFCAPLVGYIGNEIHMINFLIHLYGDSTTGKTSAAQLAASIAGSPSLKEEGLMMTWSATLNAIYGHLRGNMGIPFVIDESSIKTKGDFTQFVYNFFAGKEKSRMKRDATLKKIHKWSTALITTGEYALTEKAKSNTGIDVRISEFGNIEWTKNAQNSENIKRVVKNNYGHGIMPFAEKIASIGKVELIERFDLAEKELIEMLDNKKRLTERLTKPMSILLLTSQIVNETFGFKLSIEKIKDFLFKRLQESNAKENIGIRAFEYFLEQITIKSKHFDDITDEKGLEKMSPRGVDTWGKISNNNKNACKEVAILKKPFKEIMKEGGFEDPSVILEKWKESGRLYITNAGRKDRKRTIGNGGNSPRCYVILLDEEATKTLRKKGKKVTDIKEMFGDGA